MTTRRRFLAGLMAAGVVPKPGWADAGSPAYLSAARISSGSFVLCGLTRDGGLVFTLPLPGRGHAAAAHPSRPEAVAFARRPGTFALVIDCRDGRVLARLDSPHGRHFYGHGAFSQDGSTLYTTENDYEAGMGRIGIWDAAHSYVRTGEIASGGIGPHEIRRLPGSEVLAVANGGIDTHPDSGRSKLNIATMRPNLSYLEDGRVAETVELDPALHKNSIRHIAVAADGRVAFGMQWEGSGASPPMLGLHRRGNAARLLEAPEAEIAVLNGYVGSVAFAGDAIAITSPKGGVVQIYGAASGRFERSIATEDAGGIGPCGSGFAVTSGVGTVQRIGAGGGAPVAHPMQWDNHLVAIGPGA